MSVCRVKDYLEETNVQLGASYDVGKQSTESYGRGLEAAAGFMGAASDEIGTVDAKQVNRFQSLTIHLHCSDRPLNNSALRQPLSHPQSPRRLRTHHFLARPRSQRLPVGTPRKAAQLHDQMVASCPYLSDSHFPLSDAHPRELETAFIGEDCASDVHTCEQRAGDDSRREGDCGDGAHDSWGEAVCGRGGVGAA